MSNVYWCDKINRIYFGVKDDYKNSVALTINQIVDEANYFRSQREIALQRIDAMAAKLDTRGDDE